MKRERQRQDTKTEDEREARLSSHCIRVLHVNRDFPLFWDPILIVSSSSLMIIICLVIPFQVRVYLMQGSDASVPTIQIMVMYSQFKITIIVYSPI